MKKIALFMTLTMFFLIGSAPLKPVNTLTITADQVVSASDIEILISNASRNGTVPLTVVFDSSMGPFHYTADDRSINLFYSNLNLVSKNSAVFDNCGDGLFFDDAEVNDITIEGITFICEGLGIAGGTGHKRVTIRNNTIIAGDNSGGYTVAAENAENWSITGNQAAGGGRGIFLIQSKNMVVARNIIKSNEGVNLVNSSFISVIGNTIINARYGIILGPSSSNNRVLDNGIFSVGFSGITLTSGNEHSRVINNRVSCAGGSGCLLIDIQNPPLSHTNLVKANKFSR